MNNLQKLEEQLMQVWHNVEDLRLVASTVSDKETSDLLRGIATLQYLRVEQAFTAFETLSKEVYSLRLERDSLAKQEDCVGKYSDIVSNGGMDPRNPLDIVPANPANPPRFK